MRHVLSAIALMAPLPALASPPPPPPEYVSRAAKVLTATKAPDAAQYAPLLADDVTVFENGKTVATGKAAWINVWSKNTGHPSGRVIGYSENEGDLLVIDTFDAVDRTNLPPTSIADPRMVTRSTLYQFGSNHLIHFIRIEKTSSFWMTPHS